MPIYEYACTACSHRFEKLVRRDITPPPCPACGETRVERQFSLPSVSSETTKGKALRAAKQRDQRQATDRVQAQIAYEKSHDD
jgi:putative FmdB family regulatory protein